MRRRFLYLSPLVAAALGLASRLAGSGTPTAAQPPKGGNPKEEEALLKVAEAFAAAFDKGDAKAVAAFWTPDGDFTDLAGVKLTGREAIEKSYTEFFKEHKGLKLRIEITGLRFLTPEVAVEDGTTAVIHPDDLPPSQARYTIVHAKKGDKWYLESVRQSPYSPPSNYEHLKGLDGLVGEWVDDVEKGAAAKISFEWTDNQNFLVSHFTTTIKGISVGGGTQWIGWDPIAKTVRSWTFESTGGFGQGTWTKGEGTWTIKSSAVLADGKKAEGTNVVTKVDADTITWEVKDRTLDGKPLPDIKPVKMKRVVAK